MFGRLCQCFNSLSTFKGSVTSKGLTTRKLIVRVGQTKFIKSKDLELRTKCRLEVGKTTFMSNDQQKI